MKYQYANLTAAFKDHLDYDGHVVHGLIKADRRIALALGVHRLGTGIPLPEGGEVSTGGGTRCWRFANDAAAGSNVMCMPVAMSKKFASLNVPMGGAKTIIFGHNVPEIFDSEAAMKELLRAFAQEVLPHAPYYLCAEDVGTTPEHMRYLAQFAPKGQIAGCSQATNPSPTTARGVVIGIEAALNTCYAETPMRLVDASYAIQGLGSVGSAILDMLWKAGARKICVADIDQKRIGKALKDYMGVYAVAPEFIHTTEMEVFVPCALGGILNARTIDEMWKTPLGAYIIAGCANNQLATPEDGDRLHECGITWSPDYIINAGGAAEIICELTGQNIEKMLQSIATILETLFVQSIDEDTPTSRLADSMVAARVAAMALPQ